VPLGLLAGDTLLTFAGLALGWWLRYASPIARLGIDVPDATFARYLPLLLVGVALLVGAFAQFGLYDTRLVLRRYGHALLVRLPPVDSGARSWLPTGPRSLLVEGFELLAEDEEVFFFEETQILHEEHLMVSVSSERRAEGGLLRLEASARPVR